MNNSLIKNSLLTIGRQFFAILIGLVTSVIIARYLGPEGQGKYALITLLPLMLANFLNMGIGVSTVYYIGKKEIDLNSLYKTNVIVSIGLGIIGYLVGISIILLFSEKLFSGIPIGILSIVLLILPFLFANQLLQAVFQGQQDFRAYNVILLVSRLTLLSLVITFLIFLNGGLGETVFSFIVGQVLTSAVVIYLLKKKNSVKYLSGRFSPSYFKKSLTYGLKAHLNNVLSFLNYRVDILIISSLLGSAAIGLYVIAVNIAEKLWILSRSISSVLFPKISSLVEEKNKNEITSTICRNVLALSFAGGIIFYITSDLVIDVLFGEAYTKSSMTLKLMLPGIVLGGMAQIISNDFAGRGRLEINLYTSIFTVVINIILNIILDPIYGINGAAAATSISYCMNWMIKVAMFKRISKQSYRDLLIIGAKDLNLYKGLLISLMSRNKQ